MSYEDLYTWQHFYDESVALHRDGSCSVMLSWSGLDTQLSSPEDAQSAYLLLHRLLDQLPLAITAEFHQWREPDARQAARYLDQTKHFIRAHEVGRRFRQSMADHLSRFAINNTVAVVLTWHESARVLFPKRALIKQAHQAEQLLHVAHDLLTQLPGAQLLDSAAYILRLQQSYDRDGWVAGRRSVPHPEFFINEQVITGKPVRDEGLLRVGEHYTKVILLYLYPDAYPGISALFSSLSTSVHISHIVRRINVKAAMKASENAQNFTSGTTTHTGVEQKTLKVTHEADFRANVHVNNYQVFSNACVIHLHHDDPAALRQLAKQVADTLDGLGGQVRMSDDVQLLFWRVGQPGQGYRSTWSRRDDTQQVADMLPVQVYPTGVDQPAMLRLGRTGQLVGYTYDPDLVNHSFTVAMTGAGKGINKAAQIIETYPLGIDWYIMEVGTSYQWTVEALGGTYTRIDPGETVVNPLPLYAAALKDESGMPRLPIEMLTGTVEALSFILTDTLEMTTAQAAVAQAAFTVMYAAPTAGIDQPTFEQLLNTLQLADNYVNNDAERREATHMSDRLESFLSTAEGRIFARPNNFSLSDGITGVDLLLVRNKAKRLLKFYLVFLSLAFTQRAFSSPHRSRVLLDEMHEYVRVAPDVIKPLITGLARMGRKDGGSLDLVTQETEEIDAIERSVINQCPWQTFLYRQSDWDVIAERTHMPAAIVEYWKRYADPRGQSYRPALQRLGDDYQDLHLTFPEDILLLASSDKSDLDAKAVISAQTQDPFERLRLLKAHQEKRHEAA